MIFYSPIQKNWSQTQCLHFSISIALKTTNNQEEAPYKKKCAWTWSRFTSFSEDILACDQDRIATEALVFMLVSMRGSWKYPIGYVLIDKISADNLHCLVSRALELCVYHGFKVRTVTCDGTSTNFSVIRQFGCNLGNSLEDISGIFYSESFADPIKLARNALAYLRTIVDGKDNANEWKYIILLHEAQIKEGLKFANKLSKKHIEFNRNKMNVKIAAHVLSSSVATAIEF